VARYRTAATCARRPQAEGAIQQLATGTTGNVPLTDEEVKTLADQILWFADPRLIKSYSTDINRWFLFAYPDISTALPALPGQAVAGWWLDCWLEMRRPKAVNINGAGWWPGIRGLARDGAAVAGCTTALPRVTLSTPTCPVGVTMTRCSASCATWD